MNRTIAETKFTTLFSEQDPLVLGNGKKLNTIQVAYQSYGELNNAKDNVILVNHALTGNSHAAGIINSKEIKNCLHEKHLTNFNKMFEGKEGWWSPLIGSDKVLDTGKYFVICSNVLGSCYGTSGPTNINEENNQQFNMNFPNVSVRDMVKVQKKLFDKLGINKIKLAIGGSLGGMQVLEWALMYQDMIEKIMPIATSAAHSPWAIGLNEASYNAIINDPKWENGNYKAQPENGIKLARKIAMISYRSYSSFNEKFKRNIASSNNGINIYEIESYLDYQGEKLVKRFDANTYLFLSKAMDMHDVGIGRGGIEKALQSIKCKTNCVGISSDILYPVDEQKQIASMIPNAAYSEIESIHGHDAFLIEFEQLDKIIRNFLS